MSKFDTTLIDLVESAARTMKTTPLNLGGVSGAGGGVGSPPGGFVGWLPQGRVAYDEDEIASSGISASGGSLVDNLNHIRYRLDALEGGSGAGSGIIVTDDNNTVEYSNTTNLHFVGSGVIVTDLGSGEVQIEIDATGTGSGSGASTFLDLLDTPDSYAGQGGKYVSVNSGETALEFVTVPSGGLPDAPSDGNTYGRNSGTWTIVSPTIYDVTHYGATGDGSTDDTAAIGSAKSALDSAGGGVLYFPRGTYKVSSGFTFANPTIIRGDGKGSFGSSGLTSSISTINFTSATGTLFTFTTDYGSVEHITLQNTAATTPSAGAGIVTSGSFIAQKVNIFDASVIGFYINVDVQVGASWVFDGFDSIGCILYGIKIRNTVNPDAGDWTISNSTIITYLNNATAGIRIESSGGGKITNVKINCNPAGTAGGVKRFTYGIDISGSGNTSILLVHGCSIENINTNLIRSSGTWAYISIHGIQGALYTANNTSAISLTNATYFTVADCLLTASPPSTSSASAIALTSCSNGSVNNIISLGFNSTVSQSACTDITLDSTAPILVVEDTDGSTVSSVDTITFSGASVVDGGGGNAIVNLSSTLIVEEYDGSPYVQPVNDIVFSGIQVTDLGGGRIVASVSETVIHVYNEDLTSQIPATTFTTSNVFASGTLRIYYNGIRQRKTVHYGELSGFSSFSITFTTYSGDSMIVDYDYLGSQQSGESLVDDDSVIVVDDNTSAIIGD